MFEECRLEGDFTLTSGKKSPIFYDFDLLSSKETMEYGVQMAELLPESLIEEIDFVATPILGGIELAFVVAGILDKPRVKVLTVEKRIRGPIIPGGRYLIVDDVISTTQTLEKVIDICRPNICVGAVALMFRGTSREDLTEDFPIFYLERKEPEE